MTAATLAEIIRQAEEKRIPCRPVRNYLADKDVTAAYEIQKINIAYKLQQGQTIVGKKIGLTSEKVQAQLGVSQPDFGILLDRMHIENEGEISFNELMQPKAEAEIAFVLKANLIGDHIEMHDVMVAIDYALPAVEIVGSRIENWDIQITDTIADNASSSHFVLGNSKKKLGEIDLENCRMTLLQNNQIASEGVGKACLGNPLNAVLWLAQKMNQLGNPLKKGEVILSGALGPMVEIRQNDHIYAKIEGLGEVSFSVK